MTAEKRPQAASILRGDDDRFIDRKKPLNAEETLHTAELLENNKELDFRWLNRVGATLRSQRTTIDFLLLENEKYWDALDTIGAGFYRDHDTAAKVARDVSA